MTKYSDFVKRYMKESGKSWNCAVCDIKKGGLYKDFKKGESKQIKSDMEMMGAEDMDAPAKRLFIKKKRLRVAGQKQVKTLDPSPIPPPMALEPADSRTRTNMALGSMPELLGAMIQDFARPVAPTGEKSGKLKAIIMYGYALLERRFEFSRGDKMPSVSTLSPKDKKKVKEIIASAEIQLGKKMTKQDREEFARDLVIDAEDDSGNKESQSATDFLEEFNVRIWAQSESDWMGYNYDSGYFEDRYGDIIESRVEKAEAKWYKIYVKNWEFGGNGEIYNATLLEEMMRA